MPYASICLSNCLSIYLRWEEEAMRREVGMKASRQGVKSAAKLAGIKGNHKLWELTALFFSWWCSSFHFFIYLFLPLAEHRQIWGTETTLGRGMDADRDAVNTCCTGEVGKRKGTVWRLITQMSTQRPLQGAAQRENKGTSGGRREGERKRKRKEWRGVGERR